jgi:hypothetical protein
VPDLVATTVWTISPELVLALDAALGGPIDSYVNGSQVWLSSDGPGGVMLEWRLHPVSGYRTPKGLSHYDVWETVVGALSGRDLEPAAAAIVLGHETRPLTALWEGLECYCAYGDDVEPQPLAVAAGAALGIDPDFSGLADHERLGAEFERTLGSISLMGLLVEQLRR